MNMRRANHGFTLLEILMAFSILLLGCVGVYSVFAVGLVSHKRAVDNTTAGQLAGSLFDDIAANYDTWYMDANGNGIPDRAEDRNSNGTDDWFEPTSTGRLPFPIPYVAGYRYEVRYQRSAELDQSLFVTVRVYWRAQDRQRSAVFQRSVFIKNLPALEEP